MEAIIEENKLERDCGVIYFCNIETFKISILFTQ